MKIYWYTMKLYLTLSLKNSSSLKICSLVKVVLGLDFRLSTIVIYVETWVGKKIKSPSKGYILAGWDSINVFGNDDSLLILFLLNILSIEKDISIRSIVENWNNSFCEYYLYLLHSVFIHLISKNISDSFQEYWKAILIW